MVNSFETLIWEVRDRILLLTLNRPDHLNAFDVTMAHDLIRAFEAVQSDDEVDAVVVTGAGSAFCAGMDLAVEGNVFGLDESLDPTRDELLKNLDDPTYVNGVRDTGGRVSLAIHYCNKPVIAAINGAAVGVGATMTLSMDARLISEKGRFGLVFGKLGIVPEACSTWFLPRIVGLPNALEIVYRADILKAGDALSYGLVRSVHSPDDLVEAAIDLAKSFTAGRSRYATALARQMIRRGSSAETPLEAHIAESLAMFHASVGDGKEGVASFLEKRPPVFQAGTTELPALYERL